MNLDRYAVRVEFGLRLKALLEPALLAKKVYDHLEADFGQDSPVVMLYSGGTEQQPLTGQGVRSGILLDVHVYVIYAAEAWTPEQSQQRLDQIYGAIANWLSEPSNKNQPLWKSIRQTAASIVMTEAVGGSGYWHEVIPLRVEVY